MTKVVTVSRWQESANRVMAGAVVAPGNIGVSDRDAEEMLIASLVYCDVSLDSVRDILPTHEAFAHRDMSDWYKAILAVADETSASHVDIGTCLRWMVAHMGGEGRARELGASYERNMRATYDRVRALTHQTARARAVVVRECWLKRRIAKLAIEAEAMAYDYEPGVADIEAHLRTGLETILDDVRSDEAGVTGKDLAIEAAKALRAPPKGLELPLPRLSRMLCGLRRQETTIVAARTSVGKSMLSLQLAIGIARAGHGVSYWSGEMTPQVLASRAISHIGRVNGRFGQGEGLTAEEARRFAPACEELSRLPLILHAGQTATLQDIARAAKRHAVAMKAQGKRLELLVVDHIGLPKPSKEAAKLQRPQQVGIVSRALRELAEKLDCHVIGLAQLNREIEKAGAETLPKLSHLRESGDIEQDADNVLLLHRTRNADGSFEREKPGVILVAKNRVSGELGSIQVDVEPRYQTFTEVVEQRGWE